MRYAIVENGIVVNIVEANRPRDNTWIQIQIGAPVCIGDTWDNNVFCDKNGFQRLTPEVKAAQVRIEDLENENAELNAKIKELFERIESLEKL